MGEPITMSAEDLEETVRKVLREELRAVGLYTEDPKHSDRVRDDIKFAGKMRQAIEGAASKIGMAILLAIVGGIITLITMGAHTVIKGNGP